MRGSIVFATIIGILVLFNFFWVNEKYSKDTSALSPQSGDINFVQIAGKKIKVEIAETPEEKSRGLSGREFLSENEGMLFVFDQSDHYVFWMKDMKFSIDIIWIDEEGRIVYIKESAKPESYPEVFEPETKARYVLEVNAGFLEENNLKIGDKIEFVY